MPPARQKRLVASLLDHFHISLDRYARLTDKQLFELYLHKRDSKGSIASGGDGVEIKARTGGTYEDELESLNMAIRACNTPPAKAAELRAKLKQKFDQPKEQAPGPTPGPPDQGTPTGTEARG